MVYFLKSDNMMLQFIAFVALFAAWPAAGGSTPLRAGMHDPPRDPHVTARQAILPAVDEQVLAGPWPSFRNNSLHTGRGSNPGPLRPYQAWTFDTGGSTYSSPAVSEDGTIYVGSADSVYAITPNGRRRWAVAVGGFAISSPAVGDDGTVYIGARDGRLYALRGQDGSFKWAPFETGDEIWSSPTIDARGTTIYVGSFDGNLYAINASTGTARWAFPIGSEITSSAAIGRDGVIYVGALNSHVYAINPDGTERWRFATIGDVASSPAIGADGTIYVGSLDGALYALQANGTHRWAAPFLTGDEIVSSPAVGVDGTVYVGSVDGNLYAVRADGTERWRYEAGSEIYSSPAVDVAGVIYFGSYDGVLHAVLADGTMQWSVPLGERIWSSPAIGAGRVIYVATTDGDATVDPQFSGNLVAIGSVSFEVIFTSDPVEGESQVVEVSEPSEFRPTSARLFFRRGGERSYRGPVELAASQDGYEGAIPAEDVTLRGLQYYVELTDGNTVATYPPVNPQTNPAVRTVRIGEGLAAAVDLANARYAMVSVPLRLDDPTIRGVLEDDYNAYDPTRWRVLRWEDGAYREYTDIEADLSPGTAVFLNVRGGGEFDVDAGEAVDPSSPYRILLQPGWNQVANPFAFPVALEDVERDESVVSSFAYWDGSEMCQEATCVGVWQPWEGYFVLNESATPTSVFVRPIEASSTIVDAAERPVAGSSLIRLVAVASGGRSVDSQNWIGFHDPHHVTRSNVREAPALGDQVRLSITNDEARFARFSRLLNHEGAQWDVEVVRAERSTRRIEVRLVSEGAALPEGFRISVLDRDSGIAIPVLGDRFAVQWDGAGDVRRVRIVVGTDAFRQDVLGDAPVEALPFTLEQNYPNPFNPETEIGYYIPSASHVVLDVFDVSGRRVRRIVDEAQAAGHHRIRWNGRSDSGRDVASGVYYYKITAGSSTLAKSMLLLR